MRKLIKILLPVVMLFLSVLLFGRTNTGQAQDFGNSWQGEYFANASFQGSPAIVQVDQAINFAYGAGSPFPGIIPVDNFSIRWTGFQSIPDAIYQFTVGSDDGVRVTIDGSVIVDQLGFIGPFTGYTATVELQGGPNHLIVVEKVERTGDAAIQFQWTRVDNIQPTSTAGPTATPTNTALPPIPPGAITATVIRATVLNVRDAPSFGGNVIAKTLRGQTYQVVGRNENATWFLIELGGRQGWVWNYYVFINGNEYTPPIASFVAAQMLPGGVQDTGIVVQAKATLRLRAAPTTVSAQTGKVIWGSFLPVVGRTADNIWLQVVWKGTVGWVYSPFTNQLGGDINIVPIR